MKVNSALTADKAVGFWVYHFGWGGKDDPAQLRKYENTGMMNVYSFYGDAAVRREAAACGARFWFYAHEPFTATCEGTKIIYGLKPDWKDGILPTAGATLIVCVLLSLVWHWNDYYEPSIYLSGYDQFLLPQMLSMLSNQLANMQTDSVTQAASGLAGMNSQVLYHRGVVMAGTAICLAPPFILYIVLQRRFMEGIERSGLVE